MDRPSRGSTRSTRFCCPVSSPLRGCFRQRIVLKQSLTAGYVGWSLFWGVPACLRFLRRAWGKLLSYSVFSPIGCALIGPVLGISLIALVY